MHGVDITSPLSEEERDSIIDSIAKKIIERRLEAPAVLFLEMHRPLSFIASQAAVVALPIIGPLVGPKNMADLSRLLADRENINRLITRIEEMAAEVDGQKVEESKS